MPFHKPTQHYYNAVPPNYILIGTEHCSSAVWACGRPEWILRFLIFGLRIIFFSFSKIDYGLPRGATALLKQGTALSHFKYKQSIEKHKGVQRTVDRVGEYGQHSKHEHSACVKDFSLFSQANHIGGGFFGQHKFRINGALKIDFFCSTERAQRFVIVG